VNAAEEWNEPQCTTTKRIPRNQNRPYQRQRKEPRVRPGSMHRRRGIGQGPGRRRCSGVLPRHNKVAAIAASITASLAASVKPCAEYSSLDMTKPALMSCSWYYSDLLWVGTHVQRSRAHHTNHCRDQQRQISKGRNRCLCVALGCSPQHSDGRLAPNVYAGPIAHKFAPSPAHRISASARSQRSRGSAVREVTRTETNVSFVSRLQAVRRSRRRRAPSASSPVRPAVDPNCRAARG
jgi:hypothetical protein